MSDISQLYRKLIASRNSCLLRTNPKLLRGRAVNHDDADFSVAVFMDLAVRGLIPVLFDVCSHYVSSALLYAL